jgi:DNA-binding PadR family transcriptional regulator
MSIVALLDERPMHGYDLITELEARSGGRWKPSPGAIYPALGKLEERGLITATEAGERKQYELTDEGRQVAATLRESGAAPWDEQDLGGRGDLHRAIAELSGPARQIGRFGTPEQSAEAVAAVKEATRRLYKILADGATD